MVIDEKNKALGIPLSFSLENNMFHSSEEIARPSRGLPQVSEVPIMNKQFSTMDIMANYESLLENNSMDKVVDKMAKMAISENQNAPGIMSNNNGIRHSKTDGINSNSIDFNCINLF